MSDTQPIFGFTHGAVLRRDRIYLAGVALEFEDQDVPHAILFERDDAAWNHWSFEHRLAGIACYRRDGVDTLLTVGQDGFVEAVDTEGADEERVAADDEWPSRQRPLYCVRLIDGVVHAAGGGRQVHRRAIDAHRWERCDIGCRVEFGGGDAGSFHDIDGRDAAHLLAVGSQGALWRCDDGRWTRIAAPTDASLETVVHLGAGRYLAAGANGTLLLIDDDGVRPIAQDTTRETFCGSATAYDSVFLCSDQGSLFRLDGDILQRVDVPLQPAPGGGWLHHADGLLLFVTDMQALSFDGTRWQLLSPD